MQKFLIEVPHEAESRACAIAVKLLLETGSHFMTHAEFGCRDNDHRAWMIMEFEDTPEGCGEVLAQLPAVAVRLEDALVPIMTGLIQRMDWMAG